MVAETAEAVVCVVLDFDILAAKIAVADLACRRVAFALELESGTVESVGLLE